LDAFPLTGTGKLDRKALPDPLSASVGVGEGEEFPRNRQEEVIAGVWAEALGVSRVGVHTDFFDIGGHSLLANQVMNGIRTAFGIRLPLRTIFERRTVAELADAVVVALMAEIEAMSDDEVAAAMDAVRPRTTPEEES
ncbi:phosphopantetheine-binding protein, partial [Streptomyces hygroscopicus]